MKDENYRVRKGESKIRDIKEKERKKEKIQENEKIPNKKAMKKRQINEKEQSGIHLSRV